MEHTGTLTANISHSINPNMVLIKENSLENSGFGGVWFRKITYGITKLECAIGRVIRYG